MTGRESLPGSRRLVSRGTAVHWLLHRLLVSLRILPQHQGRSDVRSRQRTPRTQCCALPSPGSIALKRSLPHQAFRCKSPRTRATPLFCTVGWRKAIEGVHLRHDRTFPRFRCILSHIIASGTFHRVTRRPPGTRVCATLSTLGRVRPASMHLLPAVRSAMPPRGSKRSPRVYRSDHFGNFPRQKPSR